MKKILIYYWIALCLVGISLAVDISSQNIAQSTPYTRLDSDQILQAFKDYSQKYPDYFRLKYINDNSTIDFSQTKCGKGLYQKNCLYFYAEISDFKYNQNNVSSLPQVLFTGGLLGNNTLGPNIVTYLAEYLLKNALSTKISAILHERLIILYPIPNPQGFQSYNSVESQQDSRRINVDYDFPYFQQQTEDSSSQLDCLQSVSAKSLTYLFQTYLFTIGASFSLGETPSILYPLPHSGLSSNDSQQESIQKTITSHLQKNSPSNSKLFIPNYTIAQLESSSQEMNSFFEWANIFSYNQNTSPSNSQLPVCKDVQLSQQSLSAFSNKCLMFKIQCSKMEPSEQTYGDRESSSNIYSDKVGHISRNIQLSMELIEMASPYITTQIKILNNHNIYLQWQVDGCFVVSNTHLYYRVQDPLIVQQKVDLYQDIEEIKKDFILASNYTNQPGSLVSDQNFYYNTWTYQAQTSLDIIITATCDQQWKADDSSENNSLFVQLRTNQNLNATNNGYNLSSKNILMKKISSIQTVQTRVSQEQQLKSLKEQEHKNTFKFWMGILAGLGGIILIFIFGSIYVKCRDRYRDSVDLKLLSPKSDGLDLTSNNTQHHHNTSEMNQLNLTKNIDIDMSRVDNDFLNFANLK